MCHMIECNYVVRIYKHFTKIFQNNIACANVIYLESSFKTKHSIISSRPGVGKIGKI